MTIERITNTKIHNFTISTVKIGDDYETMVFDHLGNELAESHTNSRSKAETNHLVYLAKYSKNPKISYPDDVI